MFSALPLRKLSSAFGLTAAKVWYHHYFNPLAKLNHVDSIPDKKYYGVQEMSAGKRTEFLDWYDMYWIPTVRMTSLC